ncbi:MAG: DEAD/DEAH box helicase [Thermanaerothrix sp.]|nr:DEAD/DEAH box helicase [Thermanaerothrix sp.]
MPRGAARALWLESVRSETPLRRRLVVLPGSSEAGALRGDLLALGTHEPLDLPDLPVAGHDGYGMEALLLHRGRAVLRWVHQGGTMVASSAGLVLPFLSESQSLWVAVGEEARKELISWLSSQGYERVSVVWAPGQWALRGGLVDLFPPGEGAVRVVFDDDQVTEIRFFDTSTQRTVGRLNGFHVPALKGLGASDFAALGADFDLVVFEPRECEIQSEASSWLWAELRRSFPRLPEGTRWEVVLPRASRVLCATCSTSPGASDTGLIQVPGFAGRLRDAESFGRELRERGYKTLFFGATEGYLEWAAKAGFETIPKLISEGVLDSNKGVLYLSEADVAGPGGITRGAASLVPPSELLDDMTLGDLMVHEDYGVCRYQGIENLTQGGVPQDYLALEFAGGSRLLLPTYRIAKLHRIESPPDHQVELDSLRKGRWKRSLAEARQKAREAASKLLEAQARRQMQKGIAFEKLTEEMEALRSTFPHRETRDQLRCWEEICADMERPIPMDRVLVGDVGFGKTELALRAAFKAAMSGYQVLVITPTTLLAAQHHKTFSERLAAFPIRVEALYRFVPKAKQDAIRADFGQGKVDVLIGTHRVLMDDVSCRNLGLVVVDEEHRFGVMQKERWRQRFPRADVLMLSATPIPRTLQLALSGYRDISVLSTPPVDRRPVVTVVSPWQDALVVGSVMREVSRGGQVFFVHNRIQSLHKAYLRLKALFPDLRIQAAHGKMRDRELEDAMMAFMEGRVDILLCTTIIESGLDLPRANTIIVDEAHRLGLAQLYQLRGRVGRRSDQAFALFLYPDGLSRGGSLERLEAIGSMDNLGSGFHLSMVDLSLRGGGELVGTSQHGYVSNLSPELYFRLLEEEMSRLKGEGLEMPQVDWEDSPTLPGWYLEDTATRVRLYRRLFGPLDEKEVDDLKGELEDRFGPVPPEVEMLLLAALCRARLKGVASSILFGRSALRVNLISPDDFKAIKLPAGWRVCGKFIEGPTGLAGARGLAELALLFANCIR